MVGWQVSKHGGDLVCVPLALCVEEIACFLGFSRGD